MTAIRSGDSGTLPLDIHPNGLARVHVSNVTPEMPDSTSNCNGTKLETGQPSITIAEGRLSGSIRLFPELEELYSENAVAKLWKVAIREIEKQVSKVLKDFTIIRL